MNKTKPFDIPKQLFLQAFKLVKANAGAAGVDRQSLEDYESDLKDNLYKLWNRMSSGSYFPPPVMAVEIPKKAGGTRVLGVPTVSDRIAQAVVRLVFEPEVEPYFLEDSYGYRPGKSALDAIDVTRQRCWRYDWVLEFDIKGLFDDISHELLMKAVYKHTQTKWVVLYIERWLKAPMQQRSGELVTRQCGTPQGGVISPVLSNLFLHYVFDKWMQREYSTFPWCRYADDGLIHCKTQQQAHFLLEQLKQRFAECGLELHPDKTQIVYCKDGRRTGNHATTAFDFLGFTFRARACKNPKENRMFTGFVPGVSKASQKAMRMRLKRLGLRNRSTLSLEDIATIVNPIIQGWINYYGSYYRTAMNSIWRYFNQTLMAWAMKKYKRLRGRKTRAGLLIQRTAKRAPNLFAHWRKGMLGEFV